MADAPPSRPAQLTSPLPNSRPSTPGFVRPALALLAGLGIAILISGVGIILATLAALRGVDPARFTPGMGYLAANLTLTALGAMAGGFAASRITVGRSFYTVTLLALLLFVSAVIPILRGAASAPAGPGWYPITLALLAPIGVLIGGALERRPRSRTGVSA